MKWLQIQQLHDVWVYGLHSWLRVMRMVLHSTGDTACIPLHELIFQFVLEG